MDGVNWYKCTCETGFTGEHCETGMFRLRTKRRQQIIDIILLNLNIINMFICDLPFDSDINECDSSPCLNLGVCVDQVNAYNCTCAAGYTGEQCETGNELLRKTCPSKVNDSSAICKISLHIYILITC